MTTESVSNARQLHEGAVMAVGIPRDRRCPAHAIGTVQWADLQREEEAWAAI
jgi:hypothetical protein